MTDYWDRSVHDDVAEEARADWLAERPDPDLPDPSEYAPCGRCGHYICTEECT